MPTDLWRASMRAFSARQILGERGQGELNDDQHDDGPVQQLGDCTPAARGVSHGHAAKLMRVMRVANSAGRRGAARAPARRLPAATARSAAPRGWRWRLPRLTRGSLRHRGGRIAAHHPRVSRRRARERRHDQSDRPARSHRYGLRARRCHAHQLRGSYPGAEFTVDEPVLRAQEHSPDFRQRCRTPPARDAAQHARGGAARCRAQPADRVAGRAAGVCRAPAPGSAVRSAATPVAKRGCWRVCRPRCAGSCAPSACRCAIRSAAGARCIRRGCLKQSELGLTPFSALLGALQVQDEMRVRFRIVARAAGTEARRRRGSGAAAYWLPSSFSSSVAGTLAQGLEHDGRIHRHRAVQLGSNQKLPGDRVMLPSNISPPAGPAVSISALPELPPRCRCCGEIEAGLSIERALHLEPAVGNPERLLAGGALEQARQVREGLDLVPVLPPALHRAEVQAQGEGGIGGGSCRRRESGVRDLFGSGVDGASTASS